MTFASPIWLALLLPPWVAVAVWLMWSSRGERTDVPFLALWQQGDSIAPRTRREFRPPPMAIVAAMAAVLLAIAAASRPLLRGGGAGGEGGLVTIIVDRGVTMSAGDRLSETINAARPAVTEAFGDGPTDLVLVPQGQTQRVDRSAWSDIARKADATQELTAAGVKAAVQQALAKRDGPMVVLSDQAVPDSPRIVQIAPAKALQNVAITNFALRETPAPQAMVTVANDSELEKATLRVRSGDRAGVERTIDLPRSSGGETKVFVDLPSLDAAAAVAEIDVADDISIDNIAHAKRSRSFPSIEIRAPIADEVRRVVDAYTKARPATEGSKPIAIVGESAIPSDVPCAIVASPASNRESGVVTVAAHPVSAGVDWTDAKAQATGVPPGEGWRAIVSIGAHPAVAIRETPQRQVWIGFDAPDFARTPEIVIFWTNVFDWLAGDVADASTHWTSAVLPPIKTAPPPTSDWRRKMEILKPTDRSQIDITSAVLLGCVICLMLAAIAWPRRSLTPISAALTV